MSVVVAGLFDQQADATQAMDEILRLKIKDLDTRVIETQGNQDQVGGGPTIIPIVPNTAGGLSQSTPGAAGIPPIAGRDANWLDELNDDEERGFYYEGAREGATLAMARVDEDHADHIRQIFQQYGARTFIKD